MKEVDCEALERLAAEVIDEDQGHSGSSPVGRGRFQRLLGEVRFDEREVNTEHGGDTVTLANE